MIKKTYKQRNILQDMQITLFQFETCPFCVKVRDKLAELSIDYEKVNVERDREDPLRKKLLEKSGVGTVPVIRVVDENGEKYIGDSGRIIDFLDASKANN